ncbi:ABC transporter permease [Ornithinibacillus bavariensis]|uniref:ABC transporter permease n=1 Tax=Ornithinibacillus bavariensis TaxID=545502 RepID=UPI000EC4BE04|nr:ABC transporter permease [Ornithinibacillus sp.]
MASQINKGIGTLSKFIIRRDRIRIPLWLVGISFFTFIVPISFTELYGSQEQRDTLAQTMENPAMTAMLGPADLSNYTIGVMTAHEMLLFTAMAVGLMSTLLVTRHTRGDEENGRIEMIRSLRIGRLSYLNATLLVYSLINILLALIVGFGLYGFQIESMDLEGSLLYGVTLGTTGLFFAGVTAFFGQLSESSRGTIGLSIGFLLVAYIVRAVGDVGNEALSWISPFGWITKTQIYDENNWWPMALMLVVSMILFIVANYLNSNRDLEAGLLPSKPGRNSASVFLQSTIGLSFRLQRTAILSWAIGMFVLGVTYGSILGDIDSFFEGNDVLEQLFASEEGNSVTTQFVSMIIMVMAILATVSLVMTVNKLYGEEKKGRIEHILGRAVSRTRLMGSFLVISIINGFVMISLAAIGLWLAGVSTMEEPYQFETIYGWGIIYYPAMLVMISVAVLLIGIRPKITSINWMYIVYSFFVLYMGGLFQLPEWLSKLTPFGHIPQIQLEDMTWVPILILVTIAIVLTMVGFIGYNRRDIGR